MFGFGKPQTPRKFLVSTDRRDVFSVWADNENEARMQIEKQTGHNSSGVTDITDRGRGKTERERALE